MIGSVGSSSVAQQLLRATQNTAAKNSTINSQASEEANESAVEKLAEAKSGNISTNKVDIYA